MAGFPHSEIPGSKSVCRLPEAYRRLPRPSSPSAAKASTECACSLDHITEATLTPPLFAPRSLGAQERHATRELGNTVDEHSPDFTRDRDDPRRPRPQRDGPNRRADALFNFKLVSNLSRFRIGPLGPSDTSRRSRRTRSSTANTQARDAWLHQERIVARTARSRHPNTRPKPCALGSRLPLFARWWSRGGSNS